MTKRTTDQQQTELPLPKTLEETITELNAIERARTTIKRATNLSEEARAGLLAQLADKERALDPYGQRP